MPVIGITGGVATGKSVLSGLLQKEFPEAPFFSADAAAKELARCNPSVRARISELFGPGVFLTDGNVDRGKVRSLIFKDPSLRIALEDVMHPQIRAQWSDLAANANKTGGWFFAEIPLLFETDAQSLCDRVVVVACSTGTQRRRMIEQRGLSESLSEQIRGAQMSLAEKCSKSDHIIWNDCALSCLLRQARLLANWLRCRFA